jgi:hypothetical protein
MSANINTMQRPRALYRLFLPSYTPLRRPLALILLDDEDRIRGRPYGRCIGGQRLRRSPRPSWQMDGSKRDIPTDTGLPTDIPRVVTAPGETKLLLHLTLRRICLILVGSWRRGNGEARLRPHAGETRYYDFTVARNTFAPDGVQQAVIVVNGQYPVSSPSVLHVWMFWCRANEAVRVR